MKREEQKTIENLRSETVALVNEVKSLRQKNSGYKTSNENYRKQVAWLKERVEHYKQLNIEGGHLYEEKIAQLEEVQKKSLEKAKADGLEIKRLSGLVDAERERYNVLMAEKKALQEKFNEAERLVEYHMVEYHNSLPWYKRFRKI